MQERSATCRLRPSSILLILQALQNATPPIKAEDAVGLALPGGLTREVAMSFVAIPPSDGSREAAYEAFQRLLVLIGSDLLADLLNIVDAAVQRNRSSTRAANLIRRAPPNISEDLTQELTTEYTIPSDPEKPRQSAQGA